MGKVVYLQRKQAEIEEPRDPSEVYLAIAEWLQSKAKHTAHTYMRLACVWSIYLGAEFDRKKAGDLWKKATYTTAEKFLNDCLQHEARGGRAKDSSVDGKVSHATVAYKARVMKSIYECLIAKGIVEHNPFARCVFERKGVKYKGGDRSPHKRIPDEDVKKILEHSFDKGSRGLRDKALLFLLLGGALRRSEAVGIELRDVTESAKGTVVLLLRKTKTGTAQPLPLAPWVGKVLLRLKQDRERQGAKPRDRLFVRHLETSKRTPPITDVFVYRTFIRYRDELGLSEDFTPHACRVTAITRLLDQGYSHRDVKKLSRHASVMMVEKYDREREDADDSPSTDLKF